MIDEAAHYLQSQSHTSLAEQDDTAVGSSSGVRLHKLVEACSLQAVLPATAEDTGDLTLAPALLTSC